jgi:hypothetical protein
MAVTCVVRMVRSLCLLLPPLPRQATGRTMVERRFRRNMTGAQNCKRSIGADTRHLYCGHAATRPMPCPCSGQHNRLYTCAPSLPGGCNFIDQKTIGSAAILGSPKPGVAAAEAAHPASRDRTRWCSREFSVIRAVRPTNGQKPAHRFQPLFQSPDRKPLDRLVGGDGHGRGIAAVQRSAAPSRRDTQPKQPAVFPGHTGTRLITKRSILSSARNACERPTVSFRRAAGNRGRAAAAPGTCGVEVYFATTQRRDGWTAGSTGDRMQQPLREASVSCT